MKFAKILSRDEMKNVMAGSSDWYSCTCYKKCPGEKLGSVTCTSETGQLECCQAHYPDTGCTACSNSGDPVEN